MPMLDAFRQMAGALVLGMRRRADVGWLAVYIGLGSGCRAGADRTSVTMPDSAATAEMRGAAGALAGRLMGELTTALARGGPDSAIAFCADSAQALTAAAQRAGLRVRRVGTRVRNPANQPDSGDRALLDHFAAERAAGRPLPVDTVVVVAGLNGAEVRFVKPILVAEGCLACHGDPAGMTAGVRQTLATRYPADAAVGYRVGDLRGAVVVSKEPTPPR